MRDRAAKNPWFCHQSVPQTPGGLRSPPAPVAPAHPSPDSGQDLGLPRHHNNGSSECDEDAPDPVLFELRVLRSSTDATAGSRWHDGRLLCLQQCLCGFCVSKNTHINTQNPTFFSLKHGAEATIGRIRFNYLWFLCCGRSVFGDNLFCV